MCIYVRMWKCSEFESFKNDDRITQKTRIMFEIDAQLTNRTYMLLSCSVMKLHQSFSKKNLLKSSEFIVVFGIFDSCLMTLNVYDLKTHGENLLRLHRTNASFTNVSKCFLHECVYYVWNMPDTRGMQKVKVREKRAAIARIKNNSSKEICENEDLAGARFE